MTTFSGIVNVLKNSIIPEIQRVQSLYQLILQCTIDQQKQYTQQLCEISQSYKPIIVQKQLDIQEIKIELDDYGHSVQKFITLDHQLTDQDYLQLSSNVVDLEYFEQLKPLLNDKQGYKDIIIQQDKLQQFLIKVNQQISDIEQQNLDWQIMHQ
ncbi:hypothetical protein SS50377_27998 [Spironucleus salmonicida]|uniref:Uncharacterized protein n=1 Tax=Spironucleus salmonicida TaxID=348837 RepID=V6LFS7_9EUKA|nr:hypothetical protein SS50377_27998 [Spironucleus salmonicida]|eukprot:EST42556.1 Hypothetical protein SS50377_17871 [Spironucleus salmonicida]